MAKSKITISPLAAMYLAERFDVPPHPLLRVGRLPVEATEDDWTQARERGRDDLARQGLIDQDTPHSLLEEVWQLLARSPLAVGVSVDFRSGTAFNAVLAEYGRSTVEAYQADGDSPDQLRDIVVTRHEHGGCAGNAVNLFSTIKAATGASASLPLPQWEQIVQRLSGGSENVQTVLASSGIRGTEGHTLAKVLNGNRTMVGLLTVRAYDQTVRKTHDLPYTLQVVNTDDGGYIMQKKRGRDGGEWFTLAPADDRKIAATLNEMVQELKATVAR